MKNLATISALLCWMAVCMAGCSTVEGWLDDAKSDINDKIDDVQGDVVGEPDAPVVVPDAPVSDPVVQTGEDIDLSGATWHGPNGAGAKVTQQITALTFNGSVFTIATTAGTKAWPSNGEGLNQYACLAIERNGQWLAAKFDWQRPSNTPRDIKNIESGYMGWKPVSGETVYYFQMNLKLTERTTAWKVIWK